MLLVDFFISIGEVEDEWVGIGTAPGDDVVAVNAIVLVSSEFDEEMDRG